MPRVSMRPTADRVREAFGSVLARHFPGARVLDLYAGSGAWGMEAWSRGASSVTWVEKNSRIVSNLRDSIEALGGGLDPAFHVVCSHALRFIVSTKAPDNPYNLIFADPPYKEGLDNLIGERLMVDLVAPNLVAKNGLFILEQAEDTPVPSSETWELIRNKRYGGSRVLIFEKQ